MDLYSSQASSHILICFLFFNLLLQCYVFLLQPFCRVCVCVCVCVCVRARARSRTLSCFSCVQLFATPGNVAHQAPLSCDSPGKNNGVGCHALLQGIFLTCVSCIAGRFFTAELLGKPRRVYKVGGFCSNSFFTL